MQGINVCSENAMKGYINVASILGGYKFVAGLLF
jgi:hypothetical protein